MIKKEFFFKVNLIGVRIKEDQNTTLEKSCKLYFPGRGSSKNKLVEGARVMYWVTSTRSPGG